MGFMGFRIPIPGCVFDLEDDFSVYESVYFHILENEFYGVVVTNEELKKLDIPLPAKIA